MVIIEAQVTIEETWTEGTQSMSGQRSAGSFVSLMRRAAALYSVCLFRQMGPMPSSWPCASFLIGWGGRCPYCSCTLHDEIMIEAGDGIEDQVQAIVKGSMEEALERIVREVPFVVEL